MCTEKPVYNVSQVRDHPRQKPIALTNTLTFKAVSRKLVRELGAQLKDLPYLNGFCYYDGEGNPVESEAQLNKTDTLYYSTYDFTDLHYLRLLIQSPLPSIYRNAPSEWLGQLDMVNERWRVLLEPEGEGGISWWDVPANVRDGLRPIFDFVQQNAKEAVATPNVQTYNTHLHFLRDLLNRVEQFYESVTADVAKKWVPHDYATFLITLHKTLADIPSSLSLFQQKVARRGRGGAPAPDHVITRRVFLRNEQKLLVTEDSVDEMGSPGDHKDWEKMVEILRDDLKQKASRIAEVEHLRAVGILFGGGTAAFLLMRCEVHEHQSERRLVYYMSTSEVLPLLDHMKAMKDFLFRLCRIYNYGLSMKDWTGTDWTLAGSDDIAKEIAAARTGGGFQQRAHFPHLLVAGDLARKKRFSD
ncbi:hypothetical protein HK104_004456 [Borealophlyctis nickersoniae]|nr:hypothetical protein HK104_004456 [Borealophlyctis nickersoniae]